MKIGVFDSGLGGLMMTKAIEENLPAYDLVYLGDTLHVPYGNRSTDAIYLYTERCMDFLFAQNCQLIITACNTVSAAALRRLQQEYLPEHYPERRILGVVVPTLEYCLDNGHKNIGLWATQYIVKSNVYADELNKIDPSIKLQALPTPLLVPLIENDGFQWIDDVIHHYWQNMDGRDKIDSLILGCTHYPIIKERIQNIIGEQIHIISQDEMIPSKLRDYLKRHPKTQNLIGQTKQREYYASDITQAYIQTAHTLYGHDIIIQKAEI